MIMMLLARNMSGYFERLVFAFSHRRMATYACSAQVEQSWTDQIADVA
jgi:hypothetical protein